MIRLRKIREREREERESAKGVEAMKDEGKKRNRVLQQLKEIGE